MLNSYTDALKSGEGFLLKRLYEYATESEYTRYTSTKEEDWSMTLRGPARALIKYLESKDEPDSIHVDEKFQENPTAAFGVLEAKRHRERGVRFEMFLGLAKLVRQAFIDLIYETDLSEKERKQALAITHRFFDKFELGFCSEWVRHQETDLIEELQDTNRRMTNEKNRYLTIFHGISEPVFVVDREMRVMEVNVAFERFFGISGQEIKGKKCSKFVCYHLCESCPLEKAMQESSSFSNIESSISVKGEEKAVYVNGSFLVDISGKFAGGVGILQDISERRESQEEKIKLESQLRQAQKMEAIGTLAGGIAHDFNNILTPFMIRTEMAQLEAPDESPVQRHLEEILKAGNRATDLVRQILAFSRQGEQEKRSLKISLVVKEALKLLRATLPTTIEIHKKIEGKSGTVLADPTQIHQVLMNLCTNAAHAMREKGGVLEVSLVDEYLDSEAVRDIHDLSSGPYSILRVSDTGHGMDKRVVERIFDPYFTTKEKDEGTGLGLSVVHGIIRSYGGAITVHSEPGKGSTFEVFFPKIETGTPAETGKKVPLPRGTERILFVDDEKVMVETTQGMLEHLGYKVVARTSSIETLEVFRDEPETFDLVITDMTMPKMTGDELGKELMRIRPDIPIILCTGYSERITEKKAKEVGIREFVMKPIVMSEMAKTIRNVLDVR